MADTGDDGIRPDARSGPLGQSSGGLRAMPAIVLTCDRYHPFTAHMIMRYEAV
jgi:hypothetical protein